MIDFREALLKHYEKYPGLEIEDVFKLIFQAALGCEHMVTDQDTVEKRIRDEYGSVSPSEGDYVEALSEKFCRVHLSCLGGGLEADTLGKLFFLSAKTSGSREDLDEMLCVAQDMTEKGELPFSTSELREKAEAWRAQGYCPLHHSQAFRTLYDPHYRVIAREYAPILPLLSKIDALLKKGRVILAIEGGSASGKTTLAARLSEIYSACVFHMDDFFLPPAKRTRERLCEVGGNVDRERFEEEILAPLARNQRVRYKAFDCSVGDFGDYVEATPTRLVIVEGAYSMHRELSKYYDLSVFLSVDGKTQRERIMKRNTPALAKRFFEEWIPLENTYFEKTDVKNRCDLVI